MVTPLAVDGTLDMAGLEKLVEHLIKGKVHGIFILGSNGEGPSQDLKMRKRVVTEVCRLVKYRVPVLVGITDTCLNASAELASHAGRVGADVVVLAPPFYFPISQSETLAYIKHLAPKLPLPFMLYNMPGCTKVHMTPDTVARARDMGAIGIKDSSGDPKNMEDLIAALGNDPDFSLITGTESLLPETLLKGGHGAVAGGANFSPSLFVALYEACLAGDRAMKERLSEIVTYINNTIYTVGGSPSRITKGIKCTLSVLGICNDHMMPPLTCFGQAERVKIRQYLHNLNDQDQYCRIQNLA